MGESGVRERAGRSDAGVRAFDLLASKLRRPAVRPGTIRRSSVIEKLARQGSGPIVSVVAPAGYGKTTLLAQWAERNGQAFGWVQVDERDNDPKVNRPGFCGGSQSTGEWDDGSSTEVSGRAA